MIGHTLYVSGGWDSVGFTNPRTEAFYPDVGTWQTVAANPHATAAPGTAVADDKLYLVGGCVNTRCGDAPRTSCSRPATASVTQPGDYPAQLLVDSDTPERVAPLSLDLNRDAPEGLGARSPGR